MQSATASNVATITFDVRVDPDTADGTVISNQAFVSAATGGILDYPSDDPDTPIANDPTRDIVGLLPLLFSDKRAALQVDSGSPGIVDPGDVLRYTITIYNTGSVAATDVSLRDQVPSNTTYVADSTTLNGTAIRAARWRSLAADRRRSARVRWRPTLLRSCSSTYVSTTAWQRGLSSATRRRCAASRCRSC